MATLTRLFVLVLLSTALAGCGSKASAPAKDAPVWTEFEHARGRFRVDMPGKPKEQVHSSQTDRGEVQMVSNRLELKGQDKTFSVIFMDYPVDPKRADDKPMQKSLDEAVVAAGQSLGGRVEEAKSIQLGKHAGREFTVVLVESGAVLRGRIYLVGNRLYQVHASWSEARGDDATDAERFLKSFRLLE